MKKPRAGGVDPNLLGDPSVQTRYAICAYETAAQDQPLTLPPVVRAEVAPGLHWQAKANGWIYRNADDPAGLRKLVVHNRRLRIIARGENLELPGPVAADRYFDGVAFLLVNDAGLCGLLRQATFSGPSKDNTATKFVLPGGRCWLD